MRTEQHTDSIQPKESNPNADAGRFGDIQNLIRARIERLRPKLLDLSRRNPLIATRLTTRSNSLVRVVDELPDVLFFRLCNQEKMRFAPLPALDEDPKDEESRDFENALSTARHTDELYLSAMDGLDTSTGDDIEASRTLERELRDRVRSALGMPPRQTSANVSLTQHAANNDISSSYDLPDPDDAHADGRHEDEDIQTLLLPDALERKLNAVTTKCRTWIQETGINVLNAAFGLLQWSDPNGTESAFAPLVMLPVGIEKKKTREGIEFWVYSVGEEAETNLVLVEKMRREFGVDLPKFEAVSIEQYFHAIDDLMPKTMRWRVRRQVCFGIFPSARIAMYNDLDTNKFSFEENSVTANLFGGSENCGASPFAEEYEIDRPEVEQKVPSLVLDADSSQFSTIVDVADGKNLAVEGPPGTGKSQTIVNTIAVALAEGKKVLFVAEKMAALEVVKSRLEAIGLGEFLLPLQAERSTREQVIQSLRDRLHMNLGPVARDYDAKLQRFRYTRSELAAYVHALASPFAQTGYTVYEILAKCIAANKTLETLPKSLRAQQLVDVGNIDRARLGVIRDKASSLEAAWREACAAPRFWRGLKNTHLDPFTADQYRDLANDVADLFDRLENVRKELPDSCLNLNTSIEVVKDLHEVITEFDKYFPKIESPLLIDLMCSSQTKEIFDFVDKCDFSQSINSQIRTVAKHPSDSHLPHKLRRIREICAECSLENLRQEEFEKNFTDKVSWLATAQSCWSILQPLVSASPAVASMPLDSIRHMGQLAKDTGWEVLALRDDTSIDPNKLDAAIKLIEFGIELREERERIRDFINVTNSIAVSELIQHVKTLRNARIIHRVSQRYKDAKQIYLSLTLRDKFDRNQAASDLSSLARWKEKEDRLLRNYEALKLFGAHFKGVDTPFERFLSLAKFLVYVSSRFNNLSNEQKDFLRYGNTKSLFLILNVSDWPKAENLNDLEKEIAEVERYIENIRRYGSELKGLIDCFIDPDIIQISLLDEFTEMVCKFQSLAKELADDHAASSFFAGNFHGWETDTSSFRDIRPAAELSISHPLSREALARVLEGDRLNEARETVTELVRSHERASTALEKLRDQSGVAFEDYKGGWPASEIVDHFRQAAQDREGIFAHSRYADARSEMMGLGLDGVISALETVHSDLTGLSEIVEAIVFRSMAIELYKTHGSILTKFSGAKLNELRATLANLDRDIIKLSRQHVRHKIYHSALPPAGIGFGRKSDYTQLALVENEINKKKRFISVRDLTNRATEALLELKPCWMMSPLAVAQYLPLGRVTFDLCIIDEASQMPPEDAVGALARCRQAMVVGDTNQLPPTSFFRKMLDDDNANEDEAVLEESVLEMANSTFRPARRLRWHYRSQHSGLIKFSNHHVYNNDLIVFPSASETRPDMGVSFVPVQGRYRASINSEEASTMVDATLRFMRTTPDRSLGIVTLNQKQRDLLIDEMEYALNRDTKAAEYVDEWSQKNDGLESFFIKNLENVQGDERDVIYIGTVYGPETPGGPVMQRFGPINGLAGKRRLNVLFSRAKKQIVTFSSMNSEDIKAEENGNAGVYMLKRWLEYAATGALHSGETTFKEPDSDFEVYVINQLQSIGCEPVPQVGVAGYFIDIGVKHADWPHGYIMGVECDGATYHSSRSARDRDRLREEVLRRLGWHLHRIWSTDWFSDPIKEADKLRVAIETRLEKLNAEQAVFTAEPFLEKFAGSSVSTDVEQVEEENAVEPELNLYQSQNSTSSADTQQSERASLDQYIDTGDKVRVRYLSGSDNVIEVMLNDTKNSPESGIIHVNEPLGKALLGAEEGDHIEVLVGSYVRKAVIEKVVKAGVSRTNRNEPKSAHRPASPIKRSLQSKRPSTSELRNVFRREPSQTETVVKLDPDQFYDRGYLKVIQELGTEKIDQIGPITFRHLSDAIARAHGFHRTGSQIKKQVWASISKSRRSTKSPDGETTFWPNSRDPQEAIAFRGLTIDGEQRTWRDVPYAEKLGLAIDVVRSKQQREPAVEIASRIGLTRLRQATRNELENLVTAAKEHLRKH